MDIVQSVENRTKKQKWKNLVSQLEWKIHFLLSLGIIAPGLQGLELTSECPQLLIFGVWTRSNFSEPPTWKVMDILFP
jgi:hypothetical protein